MAVLYTRQSSHASKHNSLAFNGFCLRLSRSLSGVVTVQNSDVAATSVQRCPVNTTDDIVVHGDHLSVQFDHRSELCRLERIKQPLVTLATSCSNQPPTSVRRVDETMKFDLKEKRSLTRFVSQRQKQLFEKEDALIEVEIPDVPRRTIRQLSVEHPVDTIIIFASKARLLLLIESTSLH